MIIGKDKDRVWLLEVENKILKDLVHSIQKDLEAIGRALQMETCVDATDDPYRLIYFDIGRCRGMLENRK